MSPTIEAVWETGDHYVQSFLNPLSCKKEIIGRFRWVDKSEKKGNREKKNIWIKLKENERKVWCI